MTNPSYLWDGRTDWNAIIDSLKAKQKELIISRWHRQQLVTRNPHLGLEYTRKEIDTLTDRLTDVEQTIRVLSKHAEPR